MRADTSRRYRPEIAAIEAARTIGRGDPNEARLDFVLAHWPRCERPAFCIPAEWRGTWQEMPVYCYSCTRNLNQITGSRDDRL